MQTQPNKLGELEYKFPHIAWLISKGQPETLAVFRAIVEADLCHVGDGGDLYRLQCAISDLQQRTMTSDDQDAILEALKP